MSHAGLTRDPNSPKTKPASASKHNLAVVIGRFQPVHSGHMVLLRKALQIAENVLVLIGSAHCSRTIKNPFSGSERWDMIQYSLTNDEAQRVHSNFLTDNLYSDDEWMKSVQTFVKQAQVQNQVWTDKGGDGTVVLVGNKKDESSYYLDLFPQYYFESIDEIKLNFDATTIRKIMFHQPEKLDMLRSLVSDYTFDFLKKFMETKEYERLVREYEAVEQYKHSWAIAPHPPIFVTVDAVVKKAGHVLMVKRKHAPGEGLWALPGGFINAGEKLQAAAIRELVEETRIDVPRGLLQGSIKNSGVFDHPDRSLRGRTITHAYLFDLDQAEKNPSPPKVRGSDDASDAQWFEVSSLLREMRSQIYEDHLSIIRNMLGV